MSKSTREFLLCGILNSLVQKYGHSKECKKIKVSRKIIIFYQLTINELCFSKYRKIKSGMLFYYLLHGLNLFESQF